jgi:hypothetical protein
MAISIESLWGALPDLSDKINTPKRILQEQAQILADATQHLLVGDVRATGQGDSIIVRLNIVAPTLNNYRVNIVRVKHDALAYPALVFNALDSTDVLGTYCNDEQALRQKLSEILGSEKVHSVVKSLLSQASDEVVESSVEEE